MKDLKASSSQPQIEIESVAGELWITIPKTDRVVRYWRWGATTHVAGIAGFICLMAIGLLNIPDLGVDAICGFFLIVFTISLFYSLRYPERVNLFIPSTVIMRLDDVGLSVTNVERQRTHKYARDEITAVRAHRCDFSRCGMLVFLVRRKDRNRRGRAIIAVYARVQPLVEVAEKLRKEIGLDEKQRGL